MVSFHPAVEHWFRSAFREPTRAQELAWPAMLLLSDKLSGFTTGAEWIVDGGQNLRPLPFYSDEAIEQMNR